MLTQPVSIIVALLTPFDIDGNVDVTALKHHVEWLIDEGVDAVMPCGTNR
ncbi:MAG: dihydrodipicolinate synthase family protein [Actinomycetota bacterium]|nr:dihydrodipicolinate synthase family protein [Actinomycetota bacterium]